MDCHVVDADVAPDRGEIGVRGVLVGSPSLMTSASAVGVLGSDQDADVSPSTESGAWDGPGHSFSRPRYHQKAHRPPARSSAHARKGILPKRKWGGGEAGAGSVVGGARNRERRARRTRMAWCGQQSSASVEGGEKFY